MSDRGVQDAPRSSARYQLRVREDARFDPGFGLAELERVLATLAESQAGEAVAPWRRLLSENRADLASVLYQDARVVRLQRGQLLFREGDYGNSAFLVLRGAMRVVLPGHGGLTPEEEQRQRPARRSLASTFAQLWRNSRAPEARPEPTNALRVAGDGSEEVPILLEDVEQILASRETLQRVPIEVFGELAAMSRTPRTAGVFAELDDTELLEIRWQGIRDLRDLFPSFRAHTDELYRRHTLADQLARTKLFDRAGDTPKIRAAVVAGALHELFVDGLGYRSREGETLEVEHADQTVVLERVASSPARAGIEAVEVVTCRRDRPAASRALLEAVPDASSGQVLLVEETDAGASWQWLGGGRLSGSVEDRPLVVCEHRGGPEEILDQIIRPLVMLEIQKQAEFQSFGNPLIDAGDHEILEQGGYPDALIVVRSGTVRISRLLGRVMRTVSYLGPSHHFGFPEIAHNWRKPEPGACYQMALSAVRSADVVRIPSPLVERFVLPGMAEADLPELVSSDQHGSLSPVDALHTDTGLDRSLVEFLVERRLSNGTSAMLIDLDRCTRCDDCVRACASSHDGNPRFIRHGPTHGPLMVANACMHCIDPVCMIGCPTGAISRTIEGGEVVINDDTCIGCATCADNCPYDAIRVVEIREESTWKPWRDPAGKPHLRATKCDLSVGQIGAPACIRACPHDAMRRVDLTSAEKLADWMEGR